MIARVSGLACALLVASAAVTTSLCGAAAPSHVAVQRWSTQYSARQPDTDGQPRVVLYEGHGMPKIAIMQANDVSGGQICGVKAESGELAWCTYDGTATGTMEPQRGPLAVDDGTQGLMAYMQLPSRGGNLVVAQAYGGSQQWNNSNQFMLNSNGFPIPAFGGGFVFAGTETLHIFGAMFGQPCGGYMPVQSIFGGSFRTLTLPTSNGGLRKLVFAPWYSNLVMYDYTNLTVGGGGNVQQVWSFTQANGSVPSTNPYPAMSTLSADNATLIMWTEQAPQYFIALDVLTGKQTLPIVMLPLWSYVIAAPYGYVVTYNGNDGPAVFYHMIPPVLAWNASTHPATQGLQQFQCDANNGNRGPARAVCTAVPSSSSSATDGVATGTRLLGWDVATGDLLFTHELAPTLKVTGPPKLDVDGVSVYLTTAVKGGDGATNLTKFSITSRSATTTAAPQPTTATPVPTTTAAPPSPAGGIVVDEYPALNCAGTPTRVTYAVGCTASGSSTSVLRYCAGGAMRVQWFSSSATCDGTPTTAQSAKVGVCESSPLSGTSFEVVKCE